MDIYYILSTSYPTLPSLIRTVGLYRKPNSQQTSLDSKTRAAVQDGHATPDAACESTLTSD